MKKTIHRDFKVVIEICEPVWAHKSKDTYYRHMRELQSEVAEKVRAMFKGDGHEIETPYKQLTICEFCECEWEKDFDGPDGPACCNKAIDEWEARDGK